MSPKTTILSISQVGVVFMGLFGGYLTRIAPPDDRLKFWPGLATIMVSAAFLCARLLYVKRKARRARGMAVASLLLGVLLVVGYAYYSSLHVVCYRGGCRIAGSHADYSEQARKQLTRQPELSPSDLLMMADGRAGDVWTETSIEGARFRLGLTYSCAIGALAFGMLLGIEVLNG